MKAIYIGFSRAAFFSVFSKLIMFSEKTKYSHVYLKYHDEILDRYVYFQSSSIKVNYANGFLFHKKETVIDEFQFTVSDKAFLKTMQFAFDNVGKPYGVASIFGLAIVVIASVFGIKMHNPFRDAGKTWICSQLIAELLSNCENVKLPMPLNDITPKDMYEIVSKLPGELK